MIDFSLVVPSYKKAHVILKDLERKFKVLDQLNSNYEVILVVDGDDGTVDLVKNSTFDLRILTNVKNEGKGSAVRKGLVASSGKWIAYLDADLDIDPEIIKVMFEAAQEQKPDLVFANKYHSDSAYDTTFKRKFLSQVYRTLPRMKLGVDIPDTQTGAKLYSRKLINSIINDLKVDSFAFELEIFIQAVKKGFSNFVQVPVNINQGEDTTVNFKKELEIMIDTLKLMVR